MKRQMILVLAVVALFAAATGLLRSHSPSTNGLVGTAGMARSTSQEPQSAVATDKLPVEEFEDRSLVFPRETKH